MKDYKKMEEKSEQEKSVTPPKRHWKAVFIKLLVLVALAAAGYGLWKNPQIIDQVKKAVETRQEDTAAERAAVPDTGAQLAQLQNQIAALQSEVLRLSNQPQAAVEPDLTEVHEKIAAIEKTN